MKPFYDKSDLIAFLTYPDPDIQGFYGLAMTTFFEEALYGADDTPKDFIVTDELLEKKLGDEILDTLYPCAWEYFFSNIYESNVSSEMWNFIDRFLEIKGKRFSAEKRTYLEGLRDSYMSLYEVVDVELDQSITLKPLISYDTQDLIIVREKSATHHVVKWDILGVRIVKMPGYNLLSGSNLKLSNEAAELAIESIETISHFMMQPKSLQSFSGITDNPKLLVKKYWCKEIVHPWLMETLKKKHNPEKELLNTDLDPLMFYTLEFPIIGPRKQVIKSLYELPELKVIDHTSSKTQFLWPRKITGKNRKRREEENGINNQVIVDTQIHNELDGQAYSIYAEIDVKKKNVVAQANSEKRAGVLRNYLTLNLPGLIAETPTIKKQEPTQLLSKTKPKSPVDPNVPDQSTIEIQKRGIDLIMQEWLISPHPKLDEKSPLEASKFEKYKPTLISMIKQKERSDANLSKKSKAGTYQPYNYDWVLKKLKISRKDF